MTEVETYTAPATPAAPDASQTLMEKGVAKLRQHAELKAMAFDYADFITKTGACPAIYKGKPMDAAAAIIRGAALGFDPDGALEAFFVIKGKTGMYARAMVAVAENAGCELWEVEASDNSVTWAGRKPGGHEQQVTWTMDRAKKAGYTSNTRYGTNPQEMLRSKCQAELARMIAAGPLMGLYSETEEAAFEPKAVKATATRQQPQQSRGLSAIAAATNTAPQEEPVDAEVDGDDEFLADIKNTVAGMSSTTEINEFADALKADGDVPEAAKQIIMDRYNQLKEK